MRGRQLRQARSERAAAQTSQKWEGGSSERPGVTVRQLGEARSERVAPQKSQEWEGGSSERPRVRAWQLGERRRTAAQRSLEEGVVSTFMCVYFLFCLLASEFMN